ncbi:MAG: hypothetical protein IT384_03430 [Deltaproteobacteria bacterium]|nr:hypothetical protein [Deltaproteobacteria bacterium]
MVSRGARNTSARIALFVTLPAFAALAALAACGEASAPIPTEPALLRLYAFPRVVSSRGESTIAVEVSGDCAAANVVCTLCLGLAASATITPRADGGSLYVPGRSTQNTATPTAGWSAALGTTPWSLILRAPQGPTTLIVGAALKEGTTPCPDTALTDNLATATTRIQVEAALPNTATTTTATTTPTEGG